MFGLEMFIFIYVLLAVDSLWMAQNGNIEEIKMAIILPTGQWYAPSAVINDAWYCIVLHGIAWYCMVLHGIAWYAWYCMVFRGVAWCCMVMPGIA